MSELTENSHILTHWVYLKRQHDLDFTFRSWSHNILPSCNCAGTMKQRLRCCLEKSILVIIFIWETNRDICSLTPCVTFSFNVQITQPYCPCCQFCHPFQIPSYLPTCLLPLCLLAFTTCFAIYMHVVLMGWMSSRLDDVSPLSQFTEMSGVSCGHIFIWVWCGLNLTQSQTPPGDILNSLSIMSLHFSLIGHNSQLWPINLKMPSQEECWLAGLLSAHSSETEVTKCPTMHMFACRCPMFLAWVLLKAHQGDTAAGPDTDMPLSNHDLAKCSFYDLLFIFSFLDVAALLTVK